MLAAALGLGAPLLAQNELWLVQHGTANWERSRAATADGAGGVFVGGVAGGSFGGVSAGSTDGWFGRFDAAGNQVWLRQVGTSSTEEVSALAIDGSGGLYVTGVTGGDLAGPAAGLGDAWIARYDGAGNPLWMRQFGSTASDRAVAAAPDGSGGAFVGGWTLNQLGGQGAGDNDLFLARYDPAGNQLWMRVLGTPLFDALLAAAPDGAVGSS